MVEVNLQESFYRDELALRLNGSTEVGCAIGRADVVTDSEVIEVKHFPRWKEGFGQAIAYASQFPGKSPRLHLLISSDNQKWITDSIVAPLCEHYGVVLSSEVVVDTLPWDKLSKDYILSVQGRFDNRDEICGKPRTLYLLKEIESFLAQESFNGGGGEQATLNMLILEGIRTIRQRAKAEGLVYMEFKASEQSTES